MHPRFSFCTAFPLRHECSNLFSPGSLTGTILLRNPGFGQSDRPTEEVRLRVRSGCRATRFTCRIPAARWFSHGIGQSGANRGSHRRGRCGAQRRIGGNWKTRRVFWADPAASESALPTNLLSLATTRTRHVGNDPNVDCYDPDLWTDEFVAMARSRATKILHTGPAASRPLANWATLPLHCSRHSITAAPQGLRNDFG